MKLFFIGGGTAGSVTPLIPIIKKINQNNPNDDIFFICEKKDFLADQLLDDCKYKRVNVFGGKFRRYSSLKNFIDIFKIAIGFIQSFILILKIKPSIIISAGSYISVPVIIAGKILGKNVLIHQSDTIPGLTNKICKYFADYITVSFPETIKYFPAKKTIYTGNPIRKEFQKINFNTDEYIKKLGFLKNLPIICVIGGSTGANYLNKLLLSCLPNLLKSYQIIHITGKEKQIHYSDKRYIQYDFVTKELSKILSISSIIVSRAGISFLSELTKFGIPVILIPLPDSPQEKNAEYFKSINAAIVIKQKTASPDIFTGIINNSINNKKLLNELSINIRKVFKPNALDDIYKIILELS